MKNYSTLLFPILATIAACSQTSPPGQLSSGGAPASSGGVAGSVTGGTGTGGSSGGTTPMSAGGSGLGGAPNSNGGSPAAGAAGASGGATTGGVSAAGGSSATSGGSAGAAGQGTGGSGGACGSSLPSAPVVTKSIIEFNDNGGWCWYQDERALVDTKAGKFVIGSVASIKDAGGRDSDQEVVIYDIASGEKKRFTLQSDLNPDDHNAPAFVLRPDGGYAGLWATHRDNCESYYSTYSGTSWQTRKVYDWSKDGCPWDTEKNPMPPHRVTYANPWYLSAENKVYSPVRSVSTSPAMLVSSDAGSSWGFYGRLTSTTLTGYVAGYYKFWGNGVDRIDFVGTEAHPRDADTSLWHGYFKGDKLYDSKDKMVDENAADMKAQDISNFTPVFPTGQAVKNTPLYRMWNHDIARYADGTIVITGQGRADLRDETPKGSDPDKRMIYARWDGTSWKTHYLVRAGVKLYESEEDYTGLSAVDPDNPNIVFVSTTFDPRDDTTKFPKHEIFMGETCDGGATWKWAPITQGSSVDNLRPVVPKWDSTHRLVLWMQGTYRSAQDYTTKIVGTMALTPPTITNL